MNSFFYLLICCYCEIGQLNFYPQPPPYPLKNQVSRLDEALEDNGWVRGAGGQKKKKPITCIYLSCWFTAVGPQCGL